MTYEELVDRVATRAGLSHEMAARSVDAILEELADAEQAHALGPVGADLRVTRRPVLTEIAHGRVIRFRPRRQAGPGPDSAA